MPAIAKPKLAICNFLPNILYKRVLTIFFIISTNYILAQRNINSDNLFAFIGQKISIIEFDPNANSEKIIGTEIDEESGDTF